MHDAWVEFVGEQLFDTQDWQTDTQDWQTDTQDRQTRMGKAVAQCQGLQAAGTDVCNCQENRSGLMTK